MIDEARSMNCHWLTRALPLLCVLGLVSAANAEDGDEPKLVQGLIQFSPMYSAYDGVHEFQLTPSVPLTAADVDDPIDPSTLKWSFDSAYLKVDEFPDLAGALRFTTKRAGNTVVKISAKTRSGVLVRDEASVIITQIDADEWAAGDQRFNVGRQVTWALPNNSDSWICGLPRDLELPTTSACANCHGSNSQPPLGIEYTPTQTARFSDKELIRLFTAGRMPADREVYDTAFLKDSPRRDCAFKAFHIWEMSPTEQRGVLAQLRAIAPKAIESIDKTRLTTP